MKKLLLCMFFLLLITRPVFAETTDNQFFTDDFYDGLKAHTCEGFSIYFPSSWNFERKSEDGHYLYKKDMSVINYLYFGPDYDVSTDNVKTMFGYICEFEEDDDVEYYSIIDPVCVENNNCTEWLCRATVKYTFYENPFNIYDYFINAKGTPYWLEAFLMELSLPNTTSENQSLLMDFVRSIGTLQYTPNEEQPKVSSGITTSAILESMQQEEPFYGALIYTDDCFDLYLYGYSGEYVYYIFDNKADYKMGFSAQTVVFNGIGFNVFCNETMAPKSANIVKARMDDPIPGMSIKSTGGVFSVYPINDEFERIEFEVIDASVTQESNEQSTSQSE